MGADDPTAIIDDENENEDDDGATFATGVAVFAGILTAAVYAGWFLTGEVPPRFTTIIVGLWTLAVASRYGELREGDRQ